jgi:hypothetical protein
MIRRALIAFLLLSGPALAADPPQNEPGQEAMLAHRAAYRLSLDQARDNSGVAAAAGIMLFEVVDACDAWASRQRFTLIIEDRDGNRIETSSDYATLEGKNGRALRFSLTQTTEGAVTARVAGEAEATQEGGKVRYTEPEAREMALPPGTMLPTIHTIRALAAARNGRRLLIGPLFDGTTADGAQDTTTVIAGGWLAPQADPRFPALAQLGSARMRIAFFGRDQSQSGGASTPDYEVSLRYYENGVADDITMDFGGFTVKGELAELQPIPSPC